MKLTKYLALALCGGMVSACSDSFFDETSSTSLTQDQIEEVSKEDPEKVLSSQLKGCYTDWNYRRGISAGNINDHMSVGFGGIMMLSDAMSNDISLALGSGDPWHFDHALDYGAEQYVRTGWIWSWFYAIINDANAVIGVIDENDMAESAKPLLGQAYAFRGIALAYLAQFYQRTYNNDYDNGGKASTELPCVPIVLSSKEEGGVAGRATVAQVYAQVEKDLLKAIDYLDGFARDNKTVIDKNVAQGLLSRVYLVMNKWSEAAQLAHDARQGYPLNDIDIAEYWNYQDADNDEVLWAMIPTPETALYYASWASWHSVDGPGYGGTQVGCLQLIDAALYNSLSDTDVRKRLFVSPDEEGSAYPAYSNQKFDYVAQWLGNVVYMRSSELILTEAEGLLMSGNEAQAKVVMAEYMANRDLEWAAPAVLTQNYIYNQRRAELWGEGFGYFDMLRMHQPLKRTYDGTNEPAGTQVNIDEDDYLFIYQVPKSEINDNQNISAEDQNPLNGKVWTGK